MPRNLTPNELAALAAIKNDTLAAKAALRGAVTKLNALVDALQAAGQYHEEAAAMAYRGAVGHALAEVDKGHSAAMLALITLFGNGSIVIDGGGAGR